MWLVQKAVSVMLYRCGTAKQVVSVLHEL